MLLIFFERVENVIFMEKKRILKGILESFWKLNYKRRNGLVDGLKDEVELIFQKGKS